MNPSLLLQESSAIAASVGRSFLHILPYLALSIPLAVLLKRTGAAERIRKGLGDNPYLAVLLATLVGALSPFCSCGVIPIITTLLLGGVPLAPVMSFWLASPSMDPEIFVLSVGAIGWELAFWRLGATFLMSLGGGLCVLWIEKRGWLRRDFLRRSLTGGAVGPGLVPCCAGAAALPVQMEPPAGDCACASRTVIVPRPAARLLGSGTCAPQGENAAGACAPGPGAPGSGILVDILGVAWTLSIYMAIAFLLEALIIRYVPQDLIAAHLGGRSAWSVPLATLISIPMYTTNLTSLGLVAGLLQRGMSGGAALAFLIGGAVTTLPAMSAVYGIVRWRVFALYLGFCIAGSLLTGFAYQLLQGLRP